ncbi:hypothetical protein TrVGV298_002098 [Trichoderma virens]|nr:hypothetical protein TrVGV298_002098 [Trichoderma virens]
MDETKLKIIEEHPIGNGLGVFRAVFASICESQGLVSSADAIDQLDQRSLQSLTINLLAALLVLEAAQLLRSAGRGKYLFDDISKSLSIIRSDDFDLDRFKPVFRAVLDDNPNDVLIWTQLSNAVKEATPPPRPTWSSVANTPITRNTSSILNSSELRREVDQVLRKELDPRVGIRKFRESFFASVPNLDAASDAVFRKCSEGDEPLFGQEGWAGWPAAAEEKAVVAWLGDIIPKLESLAVDFAPSTLTRQRKLLAQLKTPLLGSTGKRSMDVGFVNSDFTHQLGKPSRYRWSHILVPGELKSNPKADAPPVAWIDLATYAREVLSAQDSRRFVLAFSLCGSLMRLWEYDRIGGIASEQFNINEHKGGLEFVATILGFLWMDEEWLGFDPTIVTSGDDKRFIEIERNGQPERIIIDEVITRARCVAGRATTCWKAHPEDDPETALVIKDSWQYPERDEEGEIIQEATERGAINVSRYYYHETVRIRGVDDDIRSCVRNGLDVTAATEETAATEDVTPTEDAAVTEATPTTDDTSATTVVARRASTGAIDATATVDATSAVDSAATTVIVRRASTLSTMVDMAATDDTAATTVIVRRASITSTSTASTIAATASNRRRRSTAQRSKRTPRVQQLRQSESKSSKSNNSSDNSGSSDSIGSSGRAGSKRGSSEVNEADARPAKRHRSGSSNANGSGLEKKPPNRVHRRIIVQDYGRPIYKASSPAALVAALESCIRGHESLRQAGFLHRDVSVNNVLIDEDGPPSRTGFLIDLDLAIRESREKASGAKGKTGTRAFMAIGLLFGEEHCFMHDLESFFWVLFWVCVNYDGPDKSVKNNPFDSWNYTNDYELAGSKLGVITDSTVFCKRAKETFTAFYEPLIPLMDRLREVVFPGGVRWKRADEGLYSSMREILRDEKE